MPAAVYKESKYNLGKSQQDNYFLTSTPECVIHITSYREKYFFGMTILAWSRAVILQRIDHEMLNAEEESLHRRRPNLMTTSI